MSHSWLRGIAIAVVVLGGIGLSGSRAPAWASGGCVFCATECPSDLIGFYTTQCGGAEQGSACAVEQCSSPEGPTAPYTIYCTVEVQ